ncbi:hypothetical protein BSKO_00431 [Bryopsis sp. KO-2023]|nr:hypothetical protein BSKO_00431 [Bryopsis sp. KO-2023]
MDLIIIATSILAGIVCVVVFLRNRRRDFHEHVRQLSPKKVEFTREEVAKHNKLDDLWVILKLETTNEYKVYDLTEYVDEHPGGDAIGNNAGKDATEGFHGPQHPPRAFELIGEYCIGRLVD